MDANFSLQPRSRHHDFPSDRFLWVALLGSVLRGRSRRSARRDRSLPPRRPTRPNIVVILVDDMGFSDIGCYGSEIPTPNIDALAARRRALHAVLQHGPLQPDAGVAADRPLSASGRHGPPRQHRPRRLARARTGKLRDDCVTIAEVLRDAGYFTCMTGKWHLGQQHGTPPWERGFDRSLNSPAGGVYFRQQTVPRPRLFLNGEKKMKDDPHVRPASGTAPTSGPTGG